MEATTLLEAARQIYRNYQDLRPDVISLQPRGIAIHRRTLRGDLIFSDTPVLLPNERFISVTDLESRSSA